MPVDRRAFLANGLVGLLAVPVTLRGMAANASSLAVLRHRLHGRLVTPRDASYATARRVYNARYDAVRPVAVARCRTIADVKTCVDWARSEGVAITARSGGHSYAGYSTTHGLVVDLSSLGAVTVSHSHATATIGAGARLIDVYAALAAHGATIPAGSCASVGIGGSTQGGGYGLAGRAFGMTADSVVSARVVTADGRLLGCDATHHPDLFWALRGGGGGNFGIVTDYTFRLWPVHHASYYFIDYAWSDAAAVIEAWHATAPAWPERISSVLSLTTGAATPRVTVFGQYFGGETALHDTLKPLTRAVPAASVTTGTESYLPLMLRWAGCLGITEQACHLAGVTAGGTLARASFAAKSDYLRHALPRAGAHAVTRLIEQRQGAAQGSGALLFDAYGGSVNQVAADHTAFVHRNERACLQYLAYWGTAAHAPSATSWLEHAHRTLAPYVSGAAYQNYIDPRRTDWRAAYYGANYPRLAHVKASYDPARLFRFAQAIG
jgi:FAD/FMN-containing dehydrogenase